MKFHWKPSEFAALPLREKAFVVAAIDTKIEVEKKRERELKAKSSAGK